MALGTYAGVCWVPGGHLAVLGVMNAFVHAFMYFYFFMTSFKPELKKSISWKKHITQVQMVSDSQHLKPDLTIWKSIFYLQFQFSTLLVHFLRGALAENCDFPKTWMWFLVIQNTFMLTLFTDFYRKTYLNKRKNKWKCIKNKWLDWFSLKLY